MKAWLAVIQTPLGVWESTAAVCTGNEAEYRARSMAWNNFMREAIPHFMTRGLESLAHSFRSTAENNGCKAIVREVDISTSK